MTKTKAKDVKKKDTAALIQIYSEIAAECGITLPPMSVDLSFEAAVEADRRVREKIGEAT